MIYDIKNRVEPPRPAPVSEDLGRRLLRLQLQGEPEPVFIVLPGRRGSVSALWTVMAVGAVLMAIGWWLS